MPFLATKTAPQLVPRDQFPPYVALQPLGPDQLIIASKFSLPHHAYIHLASGCGCYLRHLVMWPYIPTTDGFKPDTDSDHDLASTQPNHDALAAYLRQHFLPDGSVQFFGCWADSFAAPVYESVRLPLDAIRHPDFHFHAGARYRLLLS